MPSLMGQQAPSADVVATDGALHTLLGPLRRAVAERRPVLAVQLWTPVSRAALLPFHLQLRWPDQVDGLPLNATMSFAPFQHADRALTQTANYALEEAYMSRRFAGWYRNETGAAMPNDLHLQDWEEGYFKHRAQLRGRVVPACGYAVIGSVQPSGDVRRAPRPVLGRFASRQAHRPLVLVPGRGADTEAALAELADTTLAILNVQQAHGVRTRWAMTTLIALRADAPTLVIAASPNDILALDPEPLLETLPVELIGEPPELTDAAVTLVGRDRVQEEVRFEDAVSALRGYAAGMESVLDLAEQAWWAARQALACDAATRDRVLGRYLLALERYQHGEPVAAGLLTSATHLLDETITDAERAHERRDAVVAAAEEHLAHPSGWRTLIVVPGGADVAPLRDALAVHLGASWAEVHALGLDIRSIHAVRGERCDMLVATSYWGARTLDVALFARARQARLILDPVEARVAVAHLERLRRFLARAAWEGTQPDSRGCPARGRVGDALARMRDVLDAVAAKPTGPTISLDPRSAYNRLRDSAAAEHVSAAATTSLETTAATSTCPSPHVLIAFADGTSLLCPTDRLLNVLDDTPRGLRTISASDLRPGDEIILLEHDSHALLSDQLMRMLDEGELREERARRDQWLVLAGGIRKLERRSIRSIQLGLRERGVAADASTIRSWLPDPGQFSGGLVPRSWRDFRALAEELDLSLPEPTLRSYFDPIRRWRIVHRARGRLLIRIMRHAALRQLDVATLDRIQAAWGWKVRDLVEGVHIRLVEACTSW